LRFPSNFERVSVVKGEYFEEYCSISHKELPLFVDSYARCLEMDYDSFSLSVNDSFWDAMR